MGNTSKAIAALEKAKQAFIDYGMNVDHVPTSRHRSLMADIDEAILSMRSPHKKLLHDMESIALLYENNSERHSSREMAQAAYDMRCIARKSIEDNPCENALPPKQDLYDALGDDHFFMK